MNQNKLDTIKDFLRHCKKELNIQSMPHIKLIDDADFVLNNRSFGGYYPETVSIEVYRGSRNMADYLRSLAHELTHHRQKELNMLQLDSGETGSEIENEANAMAGILMREYGKLNSSIYEVSQVESLNEVRQPVIQEKIVKVPQEALAKAKEAYDHIQKNLEKLQQKGKGGWDKAYKDSKLKNIFKLKDLRGNDIAVSVGVYNDPSDGGEARMDVGTDTLLVNLAHFSDYDHFEDNVEHELVHAMDPKLRDTRVYYGNERGRGGVEKKGAEPEDDASYTKYVKAPWEFDAFTAPLINKVSSNLNKMGDQKKQYRQLLINLLSDLRAKDYEELAASDKYAPLAWLFTKKDWSEKNWEAAYDEYLMELNKISRWVTKPTLYKQFLKRLGMEI